MNMRLGLLAGSGNDWRDSLEKVKIAEDLGYEMIATGEAWGTSVLPWLATVATNTSKVTIASSILNTYSRTPSAMAQEYAMLEELSDGRMVLGLGSATRRMNEDWYGVPFEAPAPRMRELCELLRAVFAAQGGGELDLSACDLPGGETSGVQADGLEAFLDISAAELSRAARDLDRAELAAAADLILAAEAQGGRVHVTGVGKPEHVAHYGASLLASTGTPATFLHATEAAHGSVGQLQPGDVVIAISNSGETPELLAAVRAAGAMEVRLVAVTAAPESTLARAADRLLRARVEREGGPLGLAPRTSILVQTLAVAALSVALQERKGLTREQYALRHPAGELGKQSRT
jgi:arabinose-5-phosphate isomerase